MDFLLILLQVSGRTVTARVCGGGGGGGDWAGVWGVLAGLVYVCGVQGWGSVC